MKTIDEIKARVFRDCERLCYEQERSLDKTADCFLGQIVVCHKLADKFVALAREHGGTDFDYRADAIERGDVKDVCILCDAEAVSCSQHIPFCAEHEDKINSMIAEGAPELKQMLRERFRS